MNFKNMCGIWEIAGYGCRMMFGEIPIYVALLVVGGAFAGGFVSGLTGFGTGLTALVFWLHAVAPVLAAPLVVICSIVAQIQTLPAIWHAIDFKRVRPFIFGGVVGVPAGTVLLAHVSAANLKFTLGVFLIIYCGLMLLGQHRPKIAWGGRAMDGLVGLGGGVLGGLFGLSGALPTLWSGLRGWSKDARRGMIQAFNLTILLLAAAAQGAAGFVTLELGQLVLIALPGTLFGAWLGRRLYTGMGDRRFDQIVLCLLLVSGVFLLASS